MSVELYWVIIILLGILFINEHFISKELRIALFRETYLKEVSMAINDEVLEEQDNLDFEIQELHRRLEVYEPTQPEEKEHPKSMGA